MSESVMTLPDTRSVELVLAQLDDLPALSPIVAKVLALTGDPESRLADLVRLVESDPSLTARLIAMLSKAEHGIKSKRASVQNAVALFGCNTVRNLVLTSKIMEVFGAGSGDPSDGLWDRREFWNYALGTACAAREFAADLRLADPEEAFVWGLLHKIGMAALDVCMPKSFAKVMQRSREMRDDIVDVERALLGVDHATVGHRLATRWGLPQRLTECIWLHEQSPDALPRSVAGGGHVQLVQLAAAVVRELRLGDGGFHRDGPSGLEIAAMLGVPAARYHEVSRALVDEVEKRASWIGMASLNARDLYNRALADATDELSRVNTELTQKNQRLQRVAICFDALGELNRTLSPKASVREACAASARAIQTGLGVQSVLVFTLTRAADHSTRVDVGYCADVVKSEVLDPEVLGAGWEYEADQARRVAAAGQWLVQAGAAFERLVSRFRTQLGDETVWLLPLLGEGQWVGGALFGLDWNQVGRLRGEQHELASLSSATGLAIAYAAAQASTLALGEELLEANRRQAASQAASLRAKTLETIVAMAAGAAHEMNNPLAVIAGRAQMLAARESNPEDRADLETIVERSRLCAEIVNELMDFAKPTRPRPQELDLRTVLHEVLAKLQREASLNRAVVNTDIPSDTPLVRFDRDQLARAFFEIMKNALYATDPGRRRITVKVRTDLSDNKVVVLIGDNGTGMTADVMERVFDPFFSSRPAGRGRGLGLARVNQWLRLNGGTVRIDSSPGHGTEVELRLSLALTGDS